MSTAEVIRLFVVDGSFSFYPWLSKLKSLCGRPEALKRCRILLGEMQIVSISGYQLMIFITDTLFSSLSQLTQYIQCVAKLAHILSLNLR